jgi:hypothetical protein
VCVASYGKQSVKAQFITQQNDLLYQFLDGEGV